jgi:septal ring factor EnvC (AmiA/AmiB activator)
MAMPTNLTEWLNTAMGAFVGAVASFLALRRKYSQDSAGIAHDEVNSSLLKTLLSERDMAMSTAREAWSQRTEDAKRIAMLETQLQQREVDLKLLKDQVFAFRVELRRLNNKIKRLDPNHDSMLFLEPDPDDETEPSGDVPPIV